MLARHISHKINTGFSARRVTAPVDAGARTQANFGAAPVGTGTQARPLSAHEKTGKTLKVNHRFMGQAGDLSHSFGTTATHQTKEKMRLKTLMIQSKHESYQDPVNQRRIQQKIAVKAGELYGVDPKRMMGIRQLSKSANYGGHKMREARGVTSVSQGATGHPQGHHGAHGHHVRQIQATGGQAGALPLQK